MIYSKRNDKCNEFQMKQTLRDHVNLIRKDFNNIIWLWSEYACYKSISASYDIFLYSFNTNVELWNEIVVI